MAGLGGLVGGSALDDEFAWTGKKRSNVVRLRGLPFSATEIDIKEFFRGLQLGPDGIVICLNFQGRSTGQAYVQFASAEHANKALERNRQHIGSRYIEVFKGHPADMQGAMRMAGRGSSGVYGAPGMFGTGIPGMAGNPDMRFTGVVRMRGMPYSCTSADIVAFFKGMQVAPDGIFLCTHADGRPTGEAFVEFINEETAARAMQLHREPMGSRYVELFKSTKGEMMTSVQQKLWFSGVGNLSPLGSLAQIPGAFGMQGVGALNLGAVQPPGPGGVPAMGEFSEHVCIKMRGLPYNAGHREITEFFQGYRIVPNGIYVVIGAAERPTGEAFVEFVSSKEAQRAMERHRHNIGSRYIELFRATKSEMMVASGGLSVQLDPALQLLLLQQQAAAGAFGMAGLLGTQSAGAWTDFQNVAAAAASFYQRQAGLTGSAADPTTKLRSIPYRSST